jgi:hypothetical protein
MLMSLMKSPWKLGISLLVIAGCSGRPGAIRPPDIDADAAASRAIELYDTSGDGQLSQDEWSASPALAAVARDYDKSADGDLNVEEIAAGIAAWEKSGVGARSVPFAVSFNGKRLSGASVKLTPAPFLEDSIKPASGETEAGGTGRLGLAAEDRPRNAPNIPLMQPGLYHVEITHPTAKIPAKYNTESLLGIEISAYKPGPEGAEWTLTNLPARDSG